LQVSGLVLGAGSSSRMGGSHKLRALFDGVPLLVRAVKVLSSGLSRPPIVVLGHDAEGMKALLAGTDTVTVINPDYAEGLSTSLRLGIGAVPSSCDGVLIHLADMPAVTAADIAKLNNAFMKAGGTAIVRATHNGKRGNPVILPRSVFSLVTKLTGDMGARAIIEGFGGTIIDVELGLAASLDVDTPEAVIAAGGTII
jgi:molybdenum cofactor cytidylyltransferase